MSCAVRVARDKVRQDALPLGGQLQLRGKFIEVHPIARGISDRGGLHAV